jgi:hypothetical protein
MTRNEVEKEGCLMGQLGRRVVFRLTNADEAKLAALVTERRALNESDMLRTLIREEYERREGERLIILSDKTKDDPLPLFAKKKPVKKAAGKKPAKTRKKAAKV